MNTMSIRGLTSIRSDPLWRSVRPIESRAPSRRVQRPAEEEAHLVFFPPAPRDDDDDDDAQTPKQHKQHLKGRGRHPGSSRRCEVGTREERISKVCLARFFPLRLTYLSVDYQSSLRRWSSCGAWRQHHCKYSQQQQQRRHLHHYQHQH